MPKYTTRNDGDGPPSDKGRLGLQTDGSGYLWCAVAHTDWGKIPGKAKEDTCWYSYDGEEYHTSDFSWIHTDKYPVKVRHTESMPKRALRSGYQTDGHGKLWTAVAVTEWGEVPGKASGDTCWYPYAGKEYTTSEFFWVVKSKDGCSHSSSSSSSSSSDSD